MSSEEDLSRFRAWVCRNLGLSLDGARSIDLSQLLEERSQAMRTGGISAYLTRLEAGSGVEERRALAQRLTIGETYFFRHSDQFSALEYAALPSVVAARGETGVLRVLSAGCATGEEAYSLAICARRTLPQGWRTEVLGVDLNSASLEKARRAAYSTWSLREVSDGVRNQIVRESGRECALLEHWRDGVQFEERNLVEGDPNFWGTERFDVIFCRNVLMYFNRETMRDAVSRLAGVLAPGGFLFLSPAETLRGLSQDFHLRHTHGAFYYQKYARGEARRAPPLSFPEQSRPAFADVPSPLPLDDGTWVARIAEASARIDALARRSHSAARAPSAAPTIEAARELFRGERFEDAISLIDALPGGVGDDPDARLFHAAMLVNRGRIAEAKSLCCRILETDEMSAGAHYLLALVHEHLGEAPFAREQDAIAIHLDSAFAMPHLHLGILARRTGDLSTGKHELTEAMRLLVSEDPSRILLFGGGFSREALVLLCRAELKACGGEVRE